MSITTERTSTVLDYLPGIELDVPESVIVPLAGSWTREIEWWPADDPLGSSASFCYLVADEEFYLEIDGDGELFIRHPSWSLLGSGDSLLEAERDLLDEAKSLKGALGEIPFEQLDDEARRLLQFLDTVA